MCGIITVIKTDGSSALKAAWKRYNHQKNRGQEGFGFVAMANDFIVGYERSETEKGIRKKYEEMTADAVVFHHRFPTSIRNIEEAAHPIKVSNDKLKYDYYLVHNGCIEDDDIWKKKHEDLGFKYTTEMVYEGRIGGRCINLGGSKWNDSEALAIELAIDLDKEGSGITLDGSIAFVCVQAEKTGKVAAIYWGRNSSPLKFLETKNKMITICSQGAGSDVKLHTLCRLDCVTGVITEREYIIGADSYESHTRPKSNLLPVLSPIQPDVKFSDPDRMPAGYYILLAEEEELERKILVAQTHGVDTKIMEDELAAITADLYKMEVDHDNKSALSNLS